MPGPYGNEEPLANDAYMTKLRSIVGQYSREGVASRQPVQGNLRERVKDTETADMYKAAVNKRMPKTIPWAVDRECFCFDTLEGKRRVSPERGIGRGRPSRVPGASRSGGLSISFDTTMPTPHVATLPVGFTASGPQDSILFSSNSPQHPVARAIPGYTGHFEGHTRSMGETFGNSVGCAPASTPTMSPSGT